MHHSKLPPFTIAYRNSEEFHYLKREIWSGHLYYTEFDTPPQRIVDVGAHIGVSTLYFAKHFPTAQIVAVEPNPLVLPVLKQNLWDNQLESRVEVVSVAVALDAGQTELFHQPNLNDWQINANLSPTAWQGDRLHSSSPVQTITLASLLDQPTDLLKIDIEGTEVAVLARSKKQLINVNQAFIEFHPKADNTLAELLKVLDDQGFIYTLWKGGKEVPLADARGMLLVHATRTA